jgi:hypothetical protein
MRQPLHSLSTIRYSLFEFAFDTLSLIFS